MDVIAPDLPPNDGEAHASRPPATDALELYRLTHLGKRDGWAEAVALLVAAVDVIAAAWILGALARPDNAWIVPLSAVLLAVTGVAAGSYLGRPWARQALLVTPAVLTVIGWMKGSEDARPLLLMGGLFFTGLALFAHRSARNQLFFQRDVPRPALERYRARQQDNPMAHHAWRYGLAALITPLFAPLAVFCGAWGLRLVVREARPRAALALGGLVLGSAVLLLWYLHALELYIALTRLLRDPR
ncbi:hypothetical protein JYK02_25905 [Corallococcus macrosporus]|uniref:Uncharacterized protein n=1 Tax=Corallococcus macrosporus TaxID=35 RepID=A0ABS3DI13_9BACT|nr:hypothetical protein [Corallococcus macrosporus]MBN8230957.1 hypothetical protein [Corallococcus macrosporus]